MPVEAITKVQKLGTVAKDMIHILLAELEVKIIGLPRALPFIVFAFSVVLVADLFLMFWKTWIGWLVNIPVMKDKSWLQT